MRDTLFSFFAVLALLLVGCATLQENQASAKLVVQVATIKYVDGDEGKRARLLEAVDEARTIASTASSLAAVDAVIRQRITEAEDLDAADKLLAFGLLDVIKAELQKRFDQDLLDPEQLVAVNQVLDWVAEAAPL